MTKGKKNVYQLKKVFIARILKSWASKGPEVLYRMDLRKVQG
jgi:hypothetical protein